VKAVRRETLCNTCKNPCKQEIGIVQLCRDYEALPRVAGELLSKEKIEDQEPRSTHS